MGFQFIDSCSNEEGNPISSEPFEKPGDCNHFYQVIHVKNLIIRKLLCQGNNLKIFVTSKFFLFKIYLAQRASSGLIQIKYLFGKKHYF